MNLTQESRNNMKYIDADKLKAKVDSFMDNLWKILPDCSNVEVGELSVREASDLGAYKALESVIYMIDSLQQEQTDVDLEKEIDAVWNPRFNLGWDEHSCLTMNRAGFESFARHFYKLGLNARKEE